MTNCVTMFLLGMFFGVVIALSVEGVSLYTKKLECSQEGTYECQYVRGYFRREY